MSAVAIDNVLEALADPARRRTIDLLRSGPHRAGELARALRISAPLMSRHLSVLRRCGLVLGELSDADARVRLYRLRPQALAGLRRWLDALDAHWERQLAAFKAHVEGP